MNFDVAAEDIILDIDFSLDRNEFGYSSADKLAYIRKFSPFGHEMTIKHALKGHESEVTQVNIFKFRLNGINLIMFGLPDQMIVLFDFG